MGDNNNNNNKNSEHTGLDIFPASSLEGVVLSCVIIFGCSYDLTNLAHFPAEMRQDGLGLTS